MSLECEIVLDLAGRYFDGTASIETTRAVREHLRECPECSRFYRQFGRISKQTSAAHRSDEELAVNNFALLAERIRMRKLYKTAAVVLYSFIITGAAVALVLGSQKKNEEIRYLPVFHIPY